MYCVQCGVRLADTEKKCPLCSTVVYHPDIQQPAVPPLYPSNRIPKLPIGSKTLNGAIIILFLIPALISLVLDLQIDGKGTWVGYVVGALAILYVAIALPMWFRAPNPVIFTPCTFAAVIGYLLYINGITGGHWFMTFAFPVVGALCLIVTTLVTLLRYLKRGHLYVWGGVTVAMGGFTFLLECLLSLTFGMTFLGWSFYPMIVLAVVGMLLIYLAINRSAREMMERKLFF